MWVLNYQFGYKITEKKAYCQVFRQLFDIIGKHGSMQQLTNMGASLNALASLTLLSLNLALPLVFLLSPHQ